MASPAATGGYRFNGDAPSGCSRHSHAKMIKQSEIDIAKLIEFRESIDRTLKALSFIGYHYVMLNRCINEKKSVGESANPENGGQ